jgi:hypothetical protein
MEVRYRSGDGIIMRVASVGRQHVTVLIIRPAFPIARKELPVTKEALSYAKHTCRIPA